MYTTIVGVGNRFGGYMLRSYGQATQTIRSRRRESPKLEVVCIGYTKKKYLFLIRCTQNSNSNIKVQPYVPSTPVLYLGMDDDNGKKEGVSKNEQFGEGWERDPNRINPHLQVMHQIGLKTKNR